MRWLCCLPEIDLVPLPPGSDCYYCGADLPARLASRFVVLPFTGLDGTERALRDDYLALVEREFWTDRELATVVGSLVTKSPVPPNLLLDLCYVHWLVEKLPDAGPDLLIAFPTPELRDTAARALARPGLPECRVIRGRGEGWRRWTKDAGRFVWLRTRDLVRVAARKLAAGRPAPFPEGPVTLVRTWLDRRNFRDGGFRDLYLGSRLAEVTPPVFYLLGRTEAVTIRDHRELAGLWRRTGRTGVLEEQLITWADLVRGLVGSLAIPGRTASIRFRDLEISGLCARYRREDWVGNRHFGMALLERAWHRLCDCLPAVTAVWYPFENQPWEKLFNRVVATRFPAAIRTGCQHTVIAENYHGHFDPGWSSRPEFYPQRIETTGARSQRCLARYYGDRVTITAGYRFAYLRTMRPPAYDRYAVRGQELALALTTDPAQSGEALRLAAAALAAAPLTVLVKPHPAAGPIGGSGLPANFRVLPPETPMPELLERVRLLVYIDSVVGLEALAAGVPLVKLPPARNLDYDYVPAALRCEARTAGELRAVVAAEFAKYRDAGAYDRLVVAARSALDDYLTLPAA